MHPNNANINNPSSAPQVTPSVVPNIVSNVVNPSVVNSAPQNFENISDKPKHHILKWVGIVVGVFATLTILILVLALAATSAPVKVANEQFSDIRQNNLQAAYDLFSSDAKNQIPFDKFQTFVSTYRLSDAGSASISFSGRQVSGNTAQLDGKITVNSSVGDIQYMLIKENDAWKILSLQIVPR